MAYTQEDFNQIAEWMRDPENIKKLSPHEAATVNMYFAEYMTNIAPIIIGAMSRDEKSTFLFKL